MVTILINAGLRDAALFGGRRLFQYGYPKVRHLLQDEAYLKLISGNKVLYFFLRTIAYFGHGDIISMS